MRTRKGKPSAASPRDSGASFEAASSPPLPTPSAAPSRRYDRLDALRGFALIWMAAFHFCFDLANERVIQANFYGDPFWTMQRTCILSLFLLCAGAGQAIATAQRQSWRRFWRRWAQIVGCALLVSVGSWLMFPHSYIYFGVLHGMAVMLVIARLTAPWRLWLWPLGLIAILLPWFFNNPFFDTRATDWMGLVTHKPITEDYVPVLPWLGVMWWGLAATQWILAKRPQWLSWSGVSKPETTKAVQPSSDNAAAVAAAPAGRLRRLLVTLGQWSLTFYMVHQPVFIGALQAWTWLRGGTR